MRLIALALFAFLALTNVTFAKPMKPLIIYNHDGGVDTYLDDTWVQNAINSGRDLQIRGVCKSACTKILRMPSSRICVGPYAELWFHLVYLDNLWNSYPPKIKHWIQTHGDASGMNYIAPLKGKELQKFYPLCGK